MPTNGGAWIAPTDGRPESRQGGGEKESCQVGEVGVVNPFMHAVRRPDPAERICNGERNQSLRKYERAAHIQMDSA